MKRGLIYPWKQVIFYDFDVEIKRNLLFKIIKICEEQCDCKIRGIVCDMGNKGLLNQLGVRRKTWSHFFCESSSSISFCVYFPRYTTLCQEPSKPYLRFWHGHQGVSDKNYVLEQATLS